MKVRYPKTSGTIYDALALFDTFQNSPGTIVAVRLFLGGSGTYGDPIPASEVDLNIEGAPVSADGSFAPYGATPPTNPANGQRWIELDSSSPPNPKYGWIWIWRSSISRWLSPTQFLPLSLKTAAAAFVNTPPPYGTVLDIYAEKFRLAYSVSVAGDVSNLWTVTFDRRTSANAITTLATCVTGGGADQQIVYSTDINALISTAANAMTVFGLAAAPTGTAGTLTAGAVLEFKYARAGA